ncbi:hypothetical protein SRHO_G00115240 [Serrasalmus rhombeus]
MCALIFRTQRSLLFFPSSAEISVPFQDQLWRSYPPKPSAGRSQGGAFPRRLTGCNACNDQLRHPPVRPTGKASSSLSPAWKNSSDRRESAPLSNIPPQHAGPESHQHERWWMTESRNLCADRLRDRGRGEQTDGSSGAHIKPDSSSSVTEAQLEEGLAYVWLRTPAQAAC